MLPYINMYFFHMWGKWRKIELKFNCKLNYVPVIERFSIELSSSSWQMVVRVFATKFVCIKVSQICTQFVFDWKLDYKSLCFPIRRDNEVKLHAVLYPNISLPASSIVQAARHPSQSLVLKTVNNSSSTDFQRDK